LVFNTALIRRRIRNPRLTFEVQSVGHDSRTDVVLAYVDGLQDEALLKKLRDQIHALPISALTMGAKSLEELLIKKSWLHPLPQVRFTERPDVACSFLLEGYILVLVDNSPTAMVFPCNLFQFTQNPDDYYQNPAIGNYFRFMRFASIFLCLFLMPLFLLLGTHSVVLPEGFQIIVSSDTPFKLFLHVLLIELGLDLFNYSSSLAPGGYSHSLGLIGGLLIGQIAVDLKWLSIEALFYGAATMLASICIASKEMSDALRLYRLFLILMTEFLDYWGFGIATILIAVSAATTKTFGGLSYLWPLIPFDGKALVTLLTRYPTPKAQMPQKKKR
ncbi:MAG: spore germination protein, partial [Lachnospiraceae bacterium]|nr:spore germination protein [Lachnospiraceae bacterium]